MSCVPDWELVSHVFVARVSLGSGPRTVLHYPSTSLALLGSVRYVLDSTCASRRRSSDKSGKFVGSS